VAVDTLLCAQASQVRNRIQHKDTENDLHSKATKAAKRRKQIGKDFGVTFKFYLDTIFVAFAALL